MRNNSVVPLALAAICFHSPEQPALSSTRHSCCRRDTCTDNSVGSLASDPVFLSWLESKRQDLQARKQQARWRRGWITFVLTLVLVAVSGARNDRLLTCNKVVLELCAFSKLTWIVSLRKPYESSWQDVDRSLCSFRL